MKKRFRIVNVNRKVNSFRVDQRHSVLGIFTYWDHGALDLCPKYYFDTIEEALDAIARAITEFK